MRKASRSLIAALLGLAATAPGDAARAAPEPDPVRAAQAASAMTITRERCRAHVDFLASDLLEGRATPSRGLDLAASYVATRFAHAGLEPGGEDASFDQPFRVTIERRLAASALRSGDRTFAGGTDFIPLPLSPSGKARGEVVFAGYGITSAEEGYDDYADLDVRGKVVLVLRHEPRELEDGARFRGRRHTRHAFYHAKLENAARRGAAGLLVVTDPLNHEGRTAPEGHWPISGDMDEGPIPAAHVAPEVARALLGGTDLLEVQREIDRELAPRSFAVAGSEVALEVEVERVTGDARNVVAILRGSDPELAREAVVIGAHYDHVGVQGVKGPAFPGQLGRARGEDRIHNGADDNASGTAALLEVARALGELAPRPRRTIVLVAFAGEELGLVGSAHYVAHPVFPLERTVAMVNLDMVGRNEPEKVFVGGSPDAALRRALSTANEVAGMQVTELERGPLDGASDHASFTEAGVPTLFLFAGDHPDYHRVTDEASRIVPEKIARIARLALLTSLRVADDAEALARRAPEKKAREAEVF